MSEYGEVEYLGRGVYAQPMPGGGVNIMANHHENPTDKVWLDGHVMMSLIELLKRVKAAQEREPAQSKESKTAWKQ